MRCQDSVGLTASIQAFASSTAAVSASCWVHSGLRDRKKHVVRLPRVSQAMAALGMNWSKSASRRLE